MKKFSDFNKERLLAVAALFESSFSLDWLSELTSFKPGAILAVMEEGVHGGFLDKQPGWVFAFADSETKRQWREQLSLEEKKHWHHQIAELLLRESPHDVRNVEAAAGHLLHVQNDLNGCRLLLRVADMVKQAKSFKAALSYYGKILDDLSNIQGEEADRLFVEISHRYADIYAGRVEAEKAQAVFRKASAKAEKWGLRQDLSLLEQYTAHTYFLQSRYARAIEHSEKCVEIAKSVDSQEFWESAKAVQSISFFYQGRLTDVIRNYEASAPVIENFSLINYELSIVCVVGLCYALNGQFSQGLGLLDALRKHCLEIDNQNILNHINIHMATLMIQLHRPDEAISFLDSMPDDHDDDHSLRAKYILAYAYYLKGEMQEAFRYLKYGLERRRTMNISISTNGLWLELCKAMELGELPRFEGIRLEDEINSYIAEKNILMKGIAYQHLAALQEREGQSPEKIIGNLSLSAQLLEEAGAVFEQCRTLKALLRWQMQKGELEAADETRQKIMLILGSFGQNYIPSDLKGFVDATPRDSDALVEEILNLSQEMSSIRDEKKLMQRIISTSNRITGAERGAIFGMTIKKEGHKFQIRLKATKNITSAQVDSQAFSGTKKMIEEVVITGKGRIATNSQGINLPGQEQVLSQICVPMVIRNKVVGVLYHDNSIFLNSFKEEDLKLLGYFAAQAAIAMDNAEAYTKIQDLNQKLYQEKQYYKDQSFQNHDFEDFVGKSPSLLQVLNKIKQVADTGAIVLILGETGVGKEVVARALHNHSSRRDQPFIKVLCNALPETLIASELFGHEKGAFTGSVERRIGRFELADGGTLFLDEIGDLPLDIQTSLLNVLQSKEFERVGGSQTIRSDFRLITATNRNLKEAVRSKKFRQDLYYRLNVFPIYVPPLREREEDIPLLANYFFKTFSAQMGKTFDGIPQKEMNKLMKHDWPGNIRELEGIIERGVIMSNGPYFMVPELGVEQKESGKAWPKTTMKEMERFHILHALEQTGWKVRGPGGAAEVLDMNYSTLVSRMRKLGIVRPPAHPRGRKKGT